MDTTASSFIETAFSLGDFVNVQNGDLSLGLIVGGKLQPVGEDVYTLRLNFVVAPVEDGHVLKDTTFVLDPNDLTAVEESEQERLSFIFTEDYRSVSQEAMVLN